MMKQFQRGLIEVEIEAENLLLTRHESEEWKQRSFNSIRKKFRTTNTIVPSPFESLMSDIDSRPLVKEICATCGDHDRREDILLMFPRTDIVETVRTVLFHAAHTILEKDLARFDFESKKHQSYVKEKSFSITEKGALSDKINPSVLRSLVTLTNNQKIEEKD